MTIPRCLLPQLVPGRTEPELVAQLGPPAGRSLWFDQVLDSAHLADFAARAPGMDIPQLLREPGRPAERRHGGWAGGQLWSWRYPTNDRLWWQVSIGNDGKVISAGHGIDPLCDINDRATLF